MGISPSDPPPRTADEFEALCAGLLSDLGLGFPAHLAKGPDRGKDVVTLARLEGVGARPLRIHLECKHSRTGIAIDQGRLLSHLAWAVASDIDLLILATNSRFTAGVIDWIDQTREKRSFGVVTWDGAQLSRLKYALSQSGAGREAAVQQVHADLWAAWSRQAQSHLGRDYDRRLLARPRRATVPRVSTFIDRQEEIEILTRIDEFSLAAVTGPAGVGKTVLVHEVLHHVESLGYSPVVVDLGELSANDILGLAIPVAQAAKLRGDSDFLDFLYEYQAQNASELQARLIQCLDRAKLCVLYEDAHRVRSGSKVEAALDSLRFHYGTSRVIITSRLQGLWPTSQLQPGVQLDLGPFAEPIVRTYFRAHRIDLNNKALRSVTKVTAGLPLMLGLACRTVLRNQSAREDLLLSLGSTTDGLIRRLHAGLTDDAQSLLSLLLILREPLAREEVQVLLKFDRRRLELAEQTLEQAGLARLEEVPSRAVHQLLKDSLAPSSRLKPFHKRLAEYLGAFERDPIRCLGRVRHLLEAEEPSEALKALLLVSSTLTRTGLPEDVLQLTIRFPPELITEQEHLGISIVRSHALEVLSRHAEAYETLASVVFPELLETLPQDLKLGYYYQQARNAYFLGRYKDVERLLMVFLAEGVPRDPKRTNTRYAEALALAGRLHYIRRDLVAAQELYEKAFVIFESLGDSFGTNKMRHRLAMIKLRKGDLDGARRDLLRVEIAARRAHDAKRRAYALSRIGMIERMRENFSDAIKLQRESLSIKRILGHQRGYVFSQIELARIALAQGGLARAENEILRGLEVLGRNDMPKEAAITYGLYGIVKMRLGDPDSALSWTQRSIALFEELGLPERAQRVRRRWEDERRDGRPS